MEIKKSDKGPFQGMHYRIRKGADPYGLNVVNNTKS